MVRIRNSAKKPIKPGRIAIPSQSRHARERGEYCFVKPTHSYSTVFWGCESHDPDERGVVSMPMTARKKKKTAKRGKKRAVRKAGARGAARKTKRKTAKRKTAKRKTKRAKKVAMPEMPM